MSSSKPTVKLPATEVAAAKLWGGRFQGKLDPLFERFNHSLPVDRRLWREDLAGSIAWARALGHAGVLHAEESRKLCAALEHIGTELERDPELLASSQAEDVHAWVELRLGALVGELARKLHTGRSRNDQVATDLKLHLKGLALRLDRSLAALQLALVELAERTAALVLPGYTHLQRAQPITAGHHALAYVEMLARDRGRFADAGKRLDVSPLGSGALAGTAFAIDRERLAHELGFAHASHNSLDAVSDRDHAVELVSAAALCCVHLSRLAEDWIFLATQEAGLLELSDAISTGSSLMPQKKNPDALELLRGKSALPMARLQQLLVLQKSLPLAYNKDLQEDKAALFDALDTTLDCLEIARVVVQNVEYRPGPCRSAATHGYLNATDLADLLVHAGVPFRDAHERSGQAVRRALELGVELEALPEQERRRLFPELEGTLEQLLGVEAVLGRRAALGGTAPRRVRAEIKLWKKKLRADEDVR